MPSTWRHLCSFSNLGFQPATGPRSRWVVRSLISTLAIAILGSGCGSPDPAEPTDPVSEPVVASTDPLSTDQPSDPPSSDPVDPSELSLLIVTLDTTRADRLAPYGADDVETPNLARLAVTPVTLPSHASLFTGLYPPRHGIRNNGIHYLSDPVDTLAERLRGEGFRTAAVVSAAVLDARYGLDQGFEIYDDDLREGGPKALRLNAERPARRTVDRARQWLDQLADERFFLWVHRFDPHAPYAPPEPFLRRFVSEDGSTIDGETNTLRKVK